MRERNGLMMTIASDDEVEPEEESDSESEIATPASTAVKPALTKAGKKRQRQKVVKKAKALHAEGPLDPTFSFDVDSSLGIAEIQPTRGWDFKSELLLAYARK